MLGNFSYYNPTKLYFGDESLNFLKDELKNFVKYVIFVNSTLTKVANIQ